MTIISRLQKSESPLNGTSQTVKKDTAHKDTLMKVRPDPKHRVLSAGYILSQVLPLRKGPEIVNIFNLLGLIYFSGN